MLRPFAAKMRATSCMYFIDSGDIWMTAAVGMAEVKGLLLRQQSQMQWLKPPA